MNLVKLPTEHPMLGFKDLYESQQRGVDHLYEHDHTQFIAPMGYGKTVVAQTAIGELLIEKIIRRALVVAPKRVAQLVWPAECKQWAHLAHLRIKVIDGNAAQRAAKLFEDDADIYVIGIDHLPWLCDFLKTLPHDHRVFDLLCIDELSRLKNPRGVWCKALRKVAPLFRIRWGMTGTPRPNGYLDQYGPLSVISADKVWGRSFDSWRNLHFMAMDYKGFDWQIRIEHIAAVEAAIAKYTATVDISDMPDLPELVERDHWVDLDDASMWYYRDMERDLVASFEEDTVSAANMGVATIKLAQIVQGFLYDDDRSARFVNSAKFDALIDMVESLDGQPVIVVYEFQEDLDRMRDKWPTLHWLGGGVTDAGAKLNEDLWNKGELPILAIHPAAAGHGLNLQRGGHQIIWYGMTWSAELYDQTIARIHRQGQKERCFVHRILARNTIDEAKIDRVASKISAQAAFTRYLRRV
jgi:hypothetical protein